MANFKEAVKQFIYNDTFIINGLESLSVNPMIDSEKSDNAGFFSTLSSSIFVNTGKIYLVKRNPDYLQANMTTNEKNGLLALYNYLKKWQGNTNIGQSINFYLLKSAGVYYVNLNWNNGAYPVSNLSIPQSVINLKSYTEGYLTNTVANEWMNILNNYFNGKNPNTLLTSGEYLELQTQFDNLKNIYDTAIVANYSNLSDVEVLKLFISLGSGVMRFPKNSVNFFNLSPSEISSISLMKMSQDFNIIKNIKKGLLLNGFARFNFMIALRDHYNKYQSTAYLFADQNDKEKLSAITSGNFLKLLQTQLSILSPTGFKTNNNSIADKVGLKVFWENFFNFLRLTTMGYLKSGDVVTSDVAKYFKVDDEVSGIMNRIIALSTNVNGVVTPPLFVTEFTGSSVSTDTVPTGKMVIKVINEVLLEADKDFKAMGF